MTAETVRPLGEHRTAGALLAGIAPQFSADCLWVTVQGLGNGTDPVACSLQFSDLISFGTVEVGISWNGTIVFLFGDTRISNPQTMLHLASEFTR